MALDWGSLAATFAAGGGGGGILGYFTSQRLVGLSRESNFDKRVDERLDELEKEVADCRKRDGEVVILRMGMRMILPELQKFDPGNPVLKQVANALSALPKEGDNMHDLVQKLYEIPYDKGSGEDERSLEQD